MISKRMISVFFANRALVIVLKLRPFSRLWNAFKYSVFEASKPVSTKTLLLKHDYRHQGKTSKKKRQNGDQRWPKQKNVTYPLLHPPFCGTVISGFVFLCPWSMQNSASEMGLKEKYSHEALHSQNPKFPRVIAVKGHTPEKNKRRPIMTSPPLLA